MDSHDLAIQQFLNEHRLPVSYGQQIREFFNSLASSLVAHQQSAGRPLIVAIHGAQGSGKTTLAEALVVLFCHQHQRRALALSLDDFYLGRQQRQQLAAEVHPLLATRGVPGTHDVALAIDTLQQLTQTQGAVAVPRFDKASDDRCPETEWLRVVAPLDLVVIEGWCLGAPAQTQQALEQPVNALEAEQDPQGVWRHYVNQQLEQVYPALFDLVDKWLMLKAPSFSCVFDWRLEQENKLRQKLQTTTGTALMDAPALGRFIQHYQRISEHCLLTLPARMDFVIELDSQRQIIEVRQPQQSANSQQPRLLVFTDLDGSLLDHHSYRHDEADPTLALLAARNIPVIPVSSKTRAEIELLRDNLQNPHPFIIENGAAVLIPVGYFAKQPAGTRLSDGYWIKEFVAERQHWQHIIDLVRPDFTNEFTTFAEAGIDGIIKMTGLNVHTAARAARRHYGEPVAWHSSPGRQQQFIEAVEQAGAQVLVGGRFLHVSGGCDKGHALAWLSSVYQAQQPQQPIITVGIGDSGNDTAMLEQANLALIVRSPVHAPPKLQRQDGVYLSSYFGPRGWAEGVHKILQSCEQLHHSVSEEQL